MKTIFLSSYRLYILISLQFSFINFSRRLFTLRSKGDVISQKLTMLPKFLLLTLFVWFVWLVGGLCASIVFYVHYGNQAAGIWAAVSGKFCVHKIPNVGLPCTIIRITK